ncbi:MAG: DNA alkylation repair protein [Dehalococcoidia bacterium]|nr:DNA alkylation repair protein [Dehalococcoidia bacterium]MDD5493286.1 DNA alkylation repair protein [Dehalococcoidia bacterium]
MPDNIHVQDLKREVLSLSNKQRADFVQKYFKTGAGQYGEGDIFAGLSTSDIRKIATKYRGLSTADIERALQDEVHEMRSVALVIMAAQYKRAPEATKKKYFDLYLGNTGYINNWDLVDISAPYIIGDYLLGKDRGILYTLAKSPSLWERRIAIMSTFAFIKNGEVADTLNIARLLLDDDHDLIHKASGWMLREVGKRGNQKALEQFLDENIRYMPRTMLRYAIEKFPESKRQHYLSIKKTPK